MCGEISTANQTTPSSLLHPVVQQQRQGEISRTVRVHFTISSYTDFVDCDAVPMQACSLLLGRPWQFDKNVVHHGSTNQHTFVHKDNKIALLPMTPEQILKDDIARASKAKNRSNKRVKIRL